MEVNQVVNSGGLLESPQSISPSTFGLQNEATNIGQANKFLSDRRCKKVGDIQGHSLYKCGNRYAIIEYDGGDQSRPMIRYYVQYETNWLSLLQHNAIQQVLVWREGGFYGIASNIFFNYLLKETGCMVTDAFQTEDGQKFWIDRVKDAFSTGLNVYYIDIMAPNRVIKQLHNMNDMWAIKRVAWGESERHQEKRIIITNFNVPEQGGIDI